MQQTALFDTYAASGAKVVDFHGWALPVQFAGIVQEHKQTRTAAGLFDCSHMGEFVLQGEAAIAALDRLVFADMMNLRVGLCRYTAILNDQGGVIDDCIGIKLTEDTMFLVVNAGPTETVEEILGATPGVTNITADLTKIDIQGPKSRDVLLDHGFDVVRDLKYWNGLQFDWKGHDVIITRAGYTGELGYEIFVPNAIGPDLWNALLAHDAVEPCGLGARDTLRSEVGYPLNGEDLAQNKTPLESGMDRLIKWDKDFVGKDKLEAQRDRDDYTRLTAIQSKDRRAPRHGFEIKKDGEVVGTVTSGTFGPSVGVGVGLADLGKDCIEPGTQLTAGPRDLPIETAEIPIYKDGTCRIKF
jgi:aminomethyltransferase